MACKHKESSKKTIIPRLKFSKSKSVESMIKYDGEISKGIKEHSPAGKHQTEVKEVW